MNTLNPQQLGIKYAGFFGIAAALLIAACASIEKYDPIEAARRQFDQQDFEGGFATLEAAMTQDRKSLAIANFYRARIVAQNNEDRAISFFKKLAAEPDAPDEVYYNGAFAYIDKIPRVGPMGAGFLSKRSISQFKVVRERRADDWIAIYGIGMNYLHWPSYFKKTEGALEYFETCMQLQEGKPIKPYYILTYLRMGDALVRSGEIDRAYAVWREGMGHFPNHPDLVDRLAVSKEQIAETIKELYNPNNSIGAINTDISILWLPEVPAAAVPLRRDSLGQGGVGGQLQASRSNLSKSELGLFSWFNRNLPFLSDRQSYTRVDMSPLGVKAGAETDDLAGAIAHGMITGFLAELEGGEADRMEAKAGEVDGFTRPFFHEGLGMGYAATVSVDDVTELRKMVKAMADIDPRFNRLHLAGAGMWFGLEGARDPSQIAKAFGYLGPFGEAYAYEGYGFARALFYSRNNPHVLKVGENLQPAAAENFYHGVGRAFWILNGTDADALEKMFASVPDRYRSDAHSGYGMGVSFTKTDDPTLVFSFVNGTRSTHLDRAQLLTGMTMGYAIRELADPSYFRELVSAFSGPDRCRVTQLVSLGRESLKAAENAGSDLHANWRAEIRRRITDAGYAAGGISQCA